MLQPTLILIFIATARGTAESQQCACSTGNVHVWSGPGTNNTIVHTLTPGDCLPYSGQSTTTGDLTWFRLMYIGQDGWATSNWLSVRPCTQTTGSPVFVVSSSSTNSQLQLPGCPQIITRSEWGARAPSSDIGNMPRTPFYIFIHHGTGRACSNRSSCAAIVRSYQTYHMSTRGWPDIAYNFLVGEDGNVYEGRGWSKLGTHTLNYNDKGIAICFVGDFTSRIPTSAALSAARQLIECAVSNGKVTSSYTLKGHRDVRSTSCPGDALYRLIATWPHFMAGTSLYGA